MKHRNRRLLEWGKNLLILLLACSALYLAARTQLGRGVFQRQSGPGGWREETSMGEQADLVRPVRMAATLSAGDELTRYGVQYDTEGCDSLFQRAARPLMEALSCAQSPQPVSRQAWEEALCTGPAI